jgi:hypothetical protein
MRDGPFDRLRTAPVESPVRWAGPTEANQLAETIAYQGDDAINRSGSASAIGFDPKHITRSGTE